MIKSIYSNPYVSKIINERSVYFSKDYLSLNKKILSSGFKNSLIND